jgi:ABC-type anion transport system duplicated permease subunit
MNYISQKINKLFKLDSVISMLKFDFNVEKITILLAVLVVSYIILIPMYNLFKKILIVNNKENNSQSITQRKYRKITSQVCSGCISSSKSSKSSKSMKNNKRHKKTKKNYNVSKKINKSLRKIYLKNNF